MSWFKSLFVVIALTFASFAAHAGSYADLKGGMTMSGAKSDQFGGQFAVGYDFGQVRTEIGYGRAYSSDVSTDMLASRLLFDIPLTDQVTISPGAGLAWTELSGSEAGTDDSGIGYLALLEGSVKIDEHWSGVVGYEFVSTGAEVAGNKDFKSHMLFVGTRYNF